MGIKSFQGARKQQDVMTPTSLKVKDYMAIDVITFKTRPIYTRCCRIFN